jgi:hypothetical protein
LGVSTKQDEIIVANNQKYIYSPELTAASASTSAASKFS